MKKFFALFLGLSSTLFSSYASAQVIANLKPVTVGIYPNRDHLPGRGQNGAGIPAGVPVVLMKSNDGPYNHWNFVYYGEHAPMVYSLWLSATIAGKRVDCKPLDLGNYWVTCLGTSLLQ